MDSTLVRRSSTVGVLALGLLLTVPVLPAAAAPGAVERQLQPPAVVASASAAAEALRAANARRAAVGLAPLPPPSPEPAAPATVDNTATATPSPISGTSGLTPAERPGDPVSYVEEDVPGRSTGLLVALVGGIVALLVLIAREWTR